MRLIINTATLYQGGPIQGAASFLDECKDIRDNEYHVFLGIAAARCIDTEGFPENFHFHRIPHRPGAGPLSYMRARAIFGDLEENIKPDCVFTISGPAYWRPKARHLVGFNLGYFVYPESPFYRIITLREKALLAAKKIALFYLLKKESDAYVVQTDDVNQRLHKFLRVDKVFTVPNTHSSYYPDAPDAAQKLPGRAAGETRLLTISAFHRHKNLPIIAKVAEELKKRGAAGVRFVVTLSQNQYNALFSGARSNLILNAGPVKPEEGPSLYRECDIMFLPTLLECFSASYPEAMAMQKPILTSDLGFARGICGDAAEYFDPLDPRDIAEKIIGLIDNTGRQKELIQNGIRRLKSFYTAAERARAYLSICENMLKNNRP